MLPAGTCCVAGAPAATTSGCKNSTIVFLAARKARLRLRQRAPRTVRSSNVAASPTVRAASGRKQITSIARKERVARRLGTRSLAALRCMSSSRSRPCFSTGEPPPLPPPRTHTSRTASHTHPFTAANFLAPARRDRDAAAAASSRCTSRAAAGLAPVSRSPAWDTTRSDPIEMLRGAAWYSVPPG
jgi:hypothetical protein